MFMYITKNFPGEKNKIESRMLSETRYWRAILQLLAILSKLNKTSIWIHFKTLSETLCYSHCTPCICHYFIASDTQWTSLQRNYHEQFKPVKDLWFFKYESTIKTYCRRHWSAKIKKVFGVWECGKCCQTGSAPDINSPKLSL